MQTVDPQIYINDFIRVFHRSNVILDSMMLINLRRKLITNKEGAARAALSFNFTIVVSGLSSFKEHQ